MTTVKILIASIFACILAYYAGMKFGESVRVIDDLGSVSYSLLSPQDIIDATKFCMKNGDNAVYSARYELHNSQIRQIVEIQCTTKKESQG